MAKALRVMTFNVQQLPWLARKINQIPLVGTPGGSPEPDPEGRALAVVRAILDMPRREQPDMIAFNEAFSETARPILISHLRSKYPHIIEKLDHPGVDIEEDSGLMVFSKLPFLKLPNGDDHIFKAFPKAAGNDAKVAKGIGVVRVMGPFEVTTVAFTHLQASYDEANTENADVRAEQINFIRDVLRELADGNVQNYANSVIVGDLNIKGDPEDTSGERNFIFSNTPNTFGSDFVDGWRLSMHPPDDDRDYDPGYTQRDTPTLKANRFDYQCTRRDANVDIGLIPHQLSVPVRLPSEISDHWALLSHLHRKGPHCAPFLAVDLLKIDPINKNQPESLMWWQETDFRDEDALHWIYISKPGTFSIFLSADIEAVAFRRTDFTNALEPTDTLSISDLPGNLGLVIHRDQRLLDKGKTFSWREPYFIRIRGVKSTFSGKAPYVVLEHRGDSPATAFVLHPHIMFDPGLPEGQKLGLTDECFFKAVRPDKFTGDPYVDHFQLRNYANVMATLQIRDASGKLPPTLDVEKGTTDTIEVTRDEVGETIYIVLVRSNVNDVKFGITWKSPLSFVHLDESFRLHIDDETGPDWWDEDEFDLDIAIDGDNVFSGPWDDADAGEDWPGLSKAVNDSVESRQGHGKWAAFTDDISFSIIKTDGISAYGSEVGIIYPIDDTDGDSEQRTAGIVISAPDSDGHVTAYVSLSKFAPV